MPDERERRPDEPAPGSLERLKSDPLAQQMAHRFGLPVRREYGLATTPVPSGAVIFVDPTQDLGVEVSGLREPSIEVIPRIWTLENGLSLVGSVFVNCAPSEPQLRYARAKVRNLGRVEVNSGVLAILDRGLWSMRPEELRGDQLRQRIERQDFGEVALAAAAGAKAVLLPTGYGAGRYAVVSSFVEDRVVDLEVYLLKGNRP